MVGIVMVRFLLVASGAGGGSLAMVVSSVFSFMETGVYMLLDRVFEGVLIRGLSVVGLWNIFCWGVCSVFGCVVCVCCVFLLIWLILMRDISTCSLGSMVVL